MDNAPEDLEERLRVHSDRSYRLHIMFVFVGMFLILATPVVIAIASGEMDLDAALTHVRVTERFGYLIAFSYLVFGGGVGCVVWSVAALKRSDFCRDLVGKLTEKRRNAEHAATRGGCATGALLRTSGPEP